MANPQLWTDAHQRVLALGDAITAEQSETTVPATPDWTVRQLLAHMTGVTTDALAGAGADDVSDEWTAKHVLERADASLADILAELRGNGDGVERLLADAPASTAAGLATDLTTHEQDLRGAIGEPGARDESVQAGMDLYVHLLGAKVRERDLPAIEMRAGEWIAVAGEGDPQVIVKADAFELCRALSGRRSADQVREFDWVGDAEPYVEIFGAFGRLRPTDLVE
ncbi:MAG: maleylpyruvate isomerase N-terminal domain-containing protein [Mycobacteriales bacterium]|nr:MAG: hypothetical protein DLM56_03400 [Pseudonocardiales bacterium]